MGVIGGGEARPQSRVAQSCREQLGSKPPWWTAVWRHQHHQQQQHYSRLQTLCCTVLCCGWSDICGRGYTTELLNITDRAFIKLLAISLWIAIQLFQWLTMQLVSYWLRSYFVTNIYWPGAFFCYRILFQLKSFNK